MTDEEVLIALKTYVDEVVAIARPHQPLLLLTASDLSCAIVARGRRASSSRFRYYESVPGHITVHFPEQETILRVRVVPLDNDADVVSDVSCTVETTGRECCKIPANLALFMINMV